MKRITIAGWPDEWRDDTQTRAKYFGLRYTEKDVADIRVGMLYNDNHVSTFYDTRDECERLMRGIADDNPDYDDWWDTHIRYPNCDVMISTSERQSYTLTEIQVMTQDDCHQAYIFTDNEGNVLRLKGDGA